MNATTANDDDDDDDDSGDDDSGDGWGMLRMKKASIGRRNTIVGNVTTPHLLLILILLRVLIDIFLNYIIRFSSIFLESYGDRLFY